MPPSPLAIAQTVYGRSLSDTLKKQVYARLLPVIAGGQNVPIPFDWVQQSFQVACSPSGYERWEWEPCGRGLRPIQRLAGASS